MLPQTGYRACRLVHSSGSCGFQGSVYAALAHGIASVCNLHSITSSGSVTRSLFTSSGACLDVAESSDTAADVHDPAHGTSAAAARVSSIISAEAHVSGATMRFEVGKLARLADGSCVVSSGGSHVLATAVAVHEVEEGADFMPLQVEYKEGAYVRGHIPSGKDRRERNNSDREVLAGRAIDRAIRPLFPPGFFYDTQVYTTVLSADPLRDADVLAINAASAALTVSGIPWGGPVGAVRIARVDGQFVVDPTLDQLASATMNLTFAGTDKLALMVELVAQQVPDEVFAEALRLGQQQVAAIVAAQRQLAAQLPGRYKRQSALAGATIADEALVQAAAETDLRQILCQPGGLGKAELAAALAQVKGRTLAQLKSSGAILPKGSSSDYSSSGSEHTDSSSFSHSSSSSSAGMSETVFNLAFENVTSTLLRQAIIGQGIRPDGRGREQLRRLVCEVDTVPLVHGSALFERGETQSLCTATVAGAHPHDLLASRENPPRHLYVHYGFPPFSTNETGKVGPPGRREIGHGNLAERALLGVMPDEAEFPFTVRVNADTLASNGSSSMAAVCGGTLALSAAGVPIKDLVAGISVGLMTDVFPKANGGHAGGTALDEPYAWPQDYGRHAFITDIQGLEDHLGDMDYKVAGTSEGITAVQLDTKLPGVHVELLVDALQPAMVAREKLLAVMETCLGQSSVRGRAQYGTTEINPDFVKVMLHDRSARLEAVEARSGARLMVNEEGQVQIYAPTKAQYAAGLNGVRDIDGSNLTEGLVYRAVVLSVADHGATVEMLGTGAQHLLHVSEMSHSKLSDAREAVKEGDVLDLAYIGKDIRGFAKLSRKALLPVPPPKTAPVKLAGPGPVNAGPSRTAADSPPSIAAATTTRTAAPPSGSSKNPQRADGAWGMQQQQQPQINVTSPIGGRDRQRRPPPQRPGRGPAAQDGGNFNSSQGG